MRTTIGIALALCLGVGLYLLLGGERRGRGVAEDAPSRATGAAERSAAEVAGDTAVEHRAQEPSAGGEVERESAADTTASRSIAPTMRLLVRDGVDGRPIEGALATLDDRAAPVAVKTDAEGACVLPLMRPGESVQLRVEAPEHFHWHRPVICGPNVAVALLRAAAMHGRVLAADTDEPVAGATLAVLHGECDGCAPEFVAADARGEYELASVPLGVAAEIEVRAASFATQRRSFELHGDAPRVRQDVHLARGVVLTGRVEDWISGRGLVGARVGDFAAGADGRFEFRVLTRGTTSETTLDVRAEGHAALHAVVDVARSGELVLRLPQLAWLEGRVTDRAGAPLAGATVSVAIKGPAFVQGALVETSPIYEVAGWEYSVDAPAGTSAADGSYRAPVLPWSIDCVATASRRGFLDSEVRFAYAGEPGSVRGQDWWLTPGDARAFVEGFVKLRGRKCRPRGTVAWSGATRAGTERVEELEHGEIREPPGWFSFEVEPGDVHLSAVIDLLPALPSLEVVVHVPAGTTRSIDLDIDAPTATISGSVHYDDGAPVADVMVGACCYFPGDDAAQLIAFAFTDDEGKYEHLVLDLGLTCALWTDESRTAAAVGARAVDFEMRRSYRFFVRAREAESGRALALGRDVELRVRTAPRNPFWPFGDAETRPDADGWYEFSIALKELDLLALPRGSELPERSECLVRGVRLDGPEPARIELAIARGVELAVEVEKGAPAWPAGHELLLLPEDVHGTLPEPRGRRPTPLDELEARCTVHFDEQGRATLRGLAPGSYRFKVLPPDLAVDPELVRVEPGSPPVVIRWE